jgi:hypothetical protein
MDEEMTTLFLSLSYLHPDIMDEGMFKEMWAAGYDYGKMLSVIERVELGGQDLDEIMEEVRNDIRGVKQ